MESSISTSTLRPVSAASLIGLFLACMGMQAHAQLPAPSRTIYKCVVKGKVSYSDEPCMGAQRLDVVPTRGVNRLSGSSRTGKDVSNEIHREQFAEALRPLTGMAPARLAAETRRHHLGTQAKRECALLESAILETEQAERQSRPAMIEAVQQDLFVLRKRYKTLGC